MIDQRWLDEYVYTDAADLEPELNKLAEGAGRLADCEHRLIEAIKLKKHRLRRLPEIIRDLEAQRRGVSHDLADVLSRHDRLDTAHKLLSVVTQQLSPAQVAAAQFTRYCSACGKRFVVFSSVVTGDACPLCDEGGISDIIAEVEA